MECLGVVLDTDPSGITETDRIIEGLGADSLDLLDLVFQLERKFGIKISPRDIERLAQERLGDMPLEIDGVYTQEAIHELKAALDDIPEEEFVEGLTTADLPRLFRVSTFVNIVRRLKEGHG